MLKISKLKTSKTTILVCAIIVLVAVFGIFTVKQGQLKHEPRKLLSEKSELQKLLYSAPSHPTGSNETLEKIGQNAPIPAAFKPVALQEVKETISKFIEKSGLDAFETLAPVGGVLPATNESLPLLFPETYLTYVKTVRDWMRDRGVIKENEFASFTTNAEILVFLPRLIDFFADQGYITEMQRESFKNNLAPGFDAMKAEYLQFRSSAEAKKIVSACSAPIKNESSRRITEIFEKYFFSWLKEGLVALKIPIAEAFVPLCYKDHDPSGIIPGYNVPGIVCCNCGLKRVPFPPYLIFVPICDSPISIGGFPITPLCDIPLGCLNLVCGWMPNAIWDPTTSICGCG